MLSMKYQAKYKMNIICGGALILTYELIEKQWRIALADMSELVRHLSLKTCQYWFELGAV